VANSRCAARFKFSSSEQMMTVGLDARGPAGDQSGMGR